MKKFKNVSMVAIAAVLMMMFSSGNPCPAVDPPGHTVLLPSECCNWYFSCSDGVPIPMKCPDGLFFNDELDVCDWIQSVDCGEKQLYCSAYPGDSGGGKRETKLKKTGTGTLRMTCPDNDRIYECMEGRSDSSVKCDCTL